MEFILLPLEIQLEIFSHLPIPKVMKIREVCKHWNGLINTEFKIKELDCRQLYSPEDRAVGRDFYFLCTRSFLGYTSGNPMFSRVKFLNAYLHPNYAQLDDAFDLLNSFSYLEETWFFCFVSYSDTNQDADSDINSGIDLEAIERKQVVVSLDRLKKARFYFSSGIYTSKVSIVLDLPCLHYLQVTPLTRFTIKYPERLRILATGDGREGLFEAELDYSKFTSLTKICTDTGDVPSITANFMEKLPSLREIHLGEFGSCLYLLEPPSSSIAAPRIFYVGFEFSLNEMVSNGDQWPESIDSPEGSTFIARNLHKSIDNNRQVFSIYYNEIASELNDTEMFGMMPQKFPNIKNLRILGSVADPNRLLKFIAQFKTEQLYLKRTSLPQWFFEKLPESGPLIQELRIGTEPTMSILSDDFDFMIFKLENLRTLDFEDSPLSLDFVTKLLRELQWIHWIKFRQAGNYSFDLRLWDKSEISLDVDGINTKLIYEISREEAAEFVQFLSSQMKTCGLFVCPRQLQGLLLPLHLKERGTSS